MLDYFYNATSKRDRINFRPNQKVWVQWVDKHSQYSGCYYLATIKAKLRDGKYKTCDCPKSPDTPSR